ncbi:MAG: LptF/LptG family permease [Nonlabens sp.]|nr:LptF/LptG family permease [Nonlabens sp.]
MKILDRYILTQFIKTFLGVFIVLMFILILQSIWLYIAELAGKDLDFETIAKFMMYTVPLIVPLALPLSIIVASIMVFGSLAENYEFAAMKSNGISLQRAMRSLMIVIVGIGVISFFFANTVIPWGNLKQKNLRNNIAKKAPSMAIGEGTFNQIGDVNIKVAKKSGEANEFLNDVIIHKKNPLRYGNYTVIKSKRGELKSSLKSNVIQLVLEDGNYYEDLYPQDLARSASSPFVKSEFEEYVFNIDVSKLNSSVNIDEEVVTDNQKMLRMDELATSIDTFSVQLTENLKLYRNSQYNKWSPNAFTAMIKRQQLDTTAVLTSSEDFMKKLGNTSQLAIYENALNNISRQRAAVSNRVEQVKVEDNRIRKFEMEIHKKFVLGVACIILFFIGAPLGAIIKKGGMGLPLVIAVVFFLTYHFIGIFAEKSASEGAMPAWLGSWMSTLIIFPIGIYITYKATSDQPLIEINSSITSFFERFKKKPKLPKTVV